MMSTFTADTLYLILRYQELDHDSTHLAEVGNSQCLNFERLVHPILCFTWKVIQMKSPNAEAAPRSSGIRL